MTAIKTIATNTSEMVPPYDDDTISYYFYYKALSYNLLAIYNVHTLLCTAYATATQIINNNLI